MEFGGLVLILRGLVLVFSCELADELLVELFVSVKLGGEGVVELVGAAVLGELAAAVEFPLGMALFEEFLCFRVDFFLEKYGGLELHLGLHDGFCEVLG